MHFEDCNLPKNVIEVNFIVREFLVIFACIRPGLDPNPRMSCNKIDMGNPGNIYSNY